MQFTAVLLTEEFDKSVPFYYANRFLAFIDYWQCKQVLVRKEITKRLLAGIVVPYRIYESGQAKDVWGFWDRRSVEIQEFCHLR